MTLKQIVALGRKLVTFLGLFADCFGRREARELLRVYVKGQLSDLHRKTAEAIALWFGKPPRNLQRFLESVKWGEEKLRDRCRQIVAQDHAHPEAISPRPAEALLVRVPLGGYLGTREWGTAVTSK